MKTIPIEIQLESNTLTTKPVTLWGEETVIVLEEEKDALFDVFANDQLIGKGRLVTSQGHYAIQLVELVSS